MKRIVLVFSVLIFILIFKVSAQKVEIGSISYVPEWDQMKVVNSEGITNDGNFHFEFQDPCVIHRTAKLKVKDKLESKLLVEYLIEGKNYLGSCPSGALFYVTEEKFKAMNKRYYKTRNRIDILW